jgi:hypothetical protein
MLNMFLEQFGSTVTDIGPLTRNRSKFDGNGKINFVGNLC